MATSTAVEFDPIIFSSTLLVRYALGHFGDDLRPGEVVVADDPYHGGGHLPAHRLNTTPAVSGRQAAE